MSFAYVIKNLRVQAKLSQKQLAELIGHERSWISHLERGAIKPSEHHLQRFSSIFHINLLRPEFLKVTAKPVGGTSSASIKRCALQRFTKVWQKRASRQESSLRMPVPNIPVEQADRCLLGTLNLVYSEVVVIAKTLLQFGAVLNKLSFAELGFPMPIMGRDGALNNHYQHKCLVWNDDERSIVLFGAQVAAKPSFVPPVIAVTNGQRSAFFYVDVKRHNPLAQRRAWLNCQQLPQGCLGSQVLRLGVGNLTEREALLMLSRE